MQFPQANGRQFNRDFAYWTDVTLAGLGMICILGGIGHFLDWLSEHKPIDGKVALGFLAGLGILFLLTPRRFNFAVYSLSAIVVCGIFNAFVLRTLWGLPIILPAALICYLLLRWRGHLLK